MEAFDQNISSKNTFIIWSSVVKINSKSKVDKNKKLQMKKLSAFQGGDRRNLRNVQC